LQDLVAAVAEAEVGAQALLVVRVETVIMQAVCITQEMVEVAEAAAAGMVDVARVILGHTPEVPSAVKAVKAADMEEREDREEPPVLQGLWANPEHLDRLAKMEC
jgi:hypothetical protein